MTQHSEARDRAAGVTDAVLSFLAPFIRIGILAVALLALSIIVIWLIMSVSFHATH